MNSAKFARDNASDVVMVNVTGVDITIENRSECFAEESWQVEAIVKNTVKGALKEGDQISINYVVDKNMGCSGPGRYNPPGLTKNTSTIAFLECKEQQCSIAADAWSFDDEHNFWLEHNESYRRCLSFNKSPYRDAVSSLPYREYPSVSKFVLSKLEIYDTVCNGRYLSSSTRDSRDDVEVIHKQTFKSQQDYSSYIHRDDQNEIENLVKTHIEAYGSQIVFVLFAHKAYSNPSATDSYASIFYSFVIMNALSEYGAPSERIFRIDMESRDLLADIPRDDIRQRVDVYVLKLDQ